MAQSRILFYSNSSSDWIDGGTQGGVLLTNSPPERPDGNPGNWIVVTKTGNVVPEPSTIAFGCVALCTLAFYRRLRFEFAARTQPNS